MHRRQFIQLTSALTALGILPAACRPSKTIPGKIIGASAQIGHMVRDGAFKDAVVARPIQTEVVIVGGGASALSALRRLHRSGVNDMMLLELESHPGGNAASGSNDITAYPWGAHYIPIANNTLPEYLEFLTEAGVISGYNAAGLPIYNDYYLCSDPQERLYINGRWQDGLVPQYGVPDRELAEINRFLQQMNGFRQAKGKDGKEAFAIPIDRSSKDEQYTALDTLTMQQWLKQQQYVSSYLHWYVDYCTKDDFGTGIDTISAWAGIHYFASRKGMAANAASQDVVTWPEGNDWLIEQLSKDLQSYIHTNSVALKILPQKDTVIVQYYNVKEHTLQAVEAKQCILAVPQFVANRLLPADAQRMQLVSDHWHYTPWMVANITVRELDERSGIPLSWDNVIYGGPSLGYVDATHQQLQLIKPRKVLTYYKPLTGETIAERKRAQQRTHAQWVEMILNDLRIVHPDIAAQTDNIDIMIWGHAMAQPLPGIIHGEARKHLQKSLYNQSIHFAHTDLAGISIFEEAFYQGWNAADKVINNRML